MIYGEVLDGICINIVVADEMWIAQQPGEWILSTEDNIAWIGAKVVDGQFEEMPHSHDHPDDITS
jgi:hypothetical protein